MAAAVGLESTVEEIGDWLRTMERELGDDTEGIAELFEENGVDGTTTLSDAIPHIEVASTCAESALLLSSRRPRGHINWARRRC